MKNKKGMTANIIGIILALIVFAIVVFIFLFPEQALAKLADMGLGFANRYLKTEQEKIEVVPGEHVPVEVLKLYDSLVQEFGKGKRGGKCLREHGQFPDSFGDYKIEFTKVGREGTGIALMNKQGVQVKYEFVEKFIPCAIADEGAQNFYVNWIRGYGPKKIDKDYKEYDLIEIKYAARGVRIFLNGVVHYIEDGNLLYQADENHLCFVPTRNRLTCPDLNVEELKELHVFNQGCIDNFKEKIPICKDCSEIKNCGYYFPGDECSTDSCSVGPCFYVKYQDNSVSQCTSCTLEEKPIKRCDIFTDSDKKSCEETCPDFNCKWEGNSCLAST